MPIANALYNVSIWLFLLQHFPVIGQDISKCGVLAEPRATGQNTAILLVAANAFGCLEHLATRILWDQCGRQYGRLWQRVLPSRACKTSFDWGACSKHISRCPGSRQLLVITSRPSRSNGARQKPIYIPCAAACMASGWYYPPCADGIPRMHCEDIQWRSNNGT